jgi:hypothetical protein
VLAAAFVLVLGCTLRTYNNTDEIISNDEAFSWRIAQYPLGEVLERDKDDANPPLYYLAIKAWVAVCGDSLASMRALSALFGCLTLAAIMPFAFELSGTRDVRAGLVAALMVGVNPLQVGLGRAVRGYTIGTFLAIGSSYFLWKGLTNGRWRWWLAYALTAAAFAYTHHYALLTIAAQACFAAVWAARVLWKERRRGTILVCRGLCAGTILAALYLPWLPVLFRQLHSVQDEFWIPSLSGETLIDMGYYFITGRRGSDVATLLVTIALGLPVVVGLSWGWRPGRLYLLVLTLVPWAVAVAASVLGGRTVLIHRYLAFAQVFFLTGLGLLLAQVPDRSYRLGLIGLVCFAFGSVAVLQLGPVMDSSRGPEELCTHLARHLGPKDQIVVAQPGLANQVLYYARRAGITSTVSTVRRPAATLGHQIHAASIPDNEWVSTEDLSRMPGPNVWVVEDAMNRLSYPDTWSLSSSHVFASEDTSGWSLKKFKTQPLHRGTVGGAAQPDRTR